MEKPIDMTEEEYIEHCRKWYRKNAMAPPTIVRRRVKGIVKKFHPTDLQAAYQLEGALNRLLRTKFALRTVRNISSYQMDGALKLLNDVEALLESNN